MTFLVHLLVFTAITLAATFPLYKVCATVRRPHNPQRWAIAAVAISALTAVLGWSSRNLQTSCLAERNEGCIDIGGSGAQFLLIGGFVFWALLLAYLRYNDF